VAEARAAFGRLVGASPDRVAIGSTVSPLVATVAESLPDGAEVLLAEGEFTSVTQPFLSRRGLSVRTLPLERLAESINSRTRLVAVSTVQSADGRLAGITALRAETERHGARLLLDATQSASWQPLEATGADYLVCAAYKWLMSPRGSAFLAVSAEAADTLHPLAPGWYAGDDPWANCYDRVRFAESARRLDTAPAWLPFVGTAAALSLVEELTPARIGAHNLALAERFRKGVTALGATPVDAPDSAIVAVPGLGGAAASLAEADIAVSARAGNLRASFHLYNTADEVDRALDVLSRTPLDRP
jgi:selenocysteine lyase/cysteine desulfurase